MQIITMFIVNNRSTGKMSENGLKSITTVLKYHLSSEFGLGFFFLFSLHKFYTF